MGADIHVIIEYKRYGDWQPVTQGELNFNRSYQLFGLLAGVRMPNKHSLKPKGLPDDLSYNAMKIFYYHGENMDKWLESGDSIRINGYWITHPDLHSFSWVTLEELKTVQSHMTQASLDVELAIAIMEVYAARQIDVRMVFGFDN